MKRFAIFWMMAALMLAAAACGSSPSGPANPTDGFTAPSNEAAPAQLTQLIVGLDDTFAPMGFRDSAGQLVGFDIDLATAVGEQLGAEIIFQPIDWDAKEMELNGNKIDCIWNGMSQTPARIESMTLSQHYLNNKIIIMTTQDAAVNTKEDLRNYQLGTQAESAALEVVMSDEIYESIQDNLSEYRTYDECIMDMQAGRIQVMIVDEVLGAYKNANLDEAFNISSVNFGEDLYVIGFRKADTELCQTVESAIKALETNGIAAEISKKWFGEDLLLPIN
jgi:polar amino acid transport system substrate-binding protein